jgi:hypothetical protein
MGCLAGVGVAIGWDAPRPARTPQEARARDPVRGFMTTRYQELPPPADLRAWVQCFWTMAAAAPGPHTHRVLGRWWA